MAEKSQAEIQKYLPSSASAIRPVAVHHDHEGNSDYSTESGTEVSCLKAVAEKKRKKAEKKHLSLIVMGAGEAM